MSEEEITTSKKLPRAWDALTPPLAEWILDAVSSMGLTQATPVQKATFDFFRGNKDVVVEVLPSLLKSSISNSCSL
jgi:ATP-dependent RNA helicase DDX55/SPB4